MRFVEGVVFLLVQAVGGALFGYAVAAVGMRRRPTPQRIWGTLGALPRAQFAAYFGVLGLAWLTAVWLIWFLRGERYTVPVAGALGVVVVVLVAGWIAAVLRDRSRRRAI
ncbi:hypothetical protein Daura_31760 [Dactylosporangium aurantiacum]|uniref:Uncharacterized protein n=1 Tax=Dactylosporangium aurantiacum TaxID=35754 RepID=A0A9Q9IBJ6_9ACTN|nr:hypothetical protein [Dactylosporangium aurantiacum]MDG6109525.1 hypothetical protein [Dactylosporangium aurantiacum]UWZ51318.1 hypothetical protein Daura_31760 [Dactylosporangium aurantiacum]